MRGARTGYVVPMTYLGIYLNDHRAAAAGGLRVAQRCRGSNEGSELGSFLDDFVDELRRDESLVDSVMDALDIRQNPLKQTLVVAAEFVGRWKPNGHFISYSPLSRVLELEGLIAGVHAKQRLWVVLLSAIESESLRNEISDAEGRARRQLEHLEDFHEAALRIAFTGEGTTTG